jgi:hypothetical protein
MTETHPGWCGCIIGLSPKKAPNADLLHYMGHEKAERDCVFSLEYKVGSRDKITDKALAKLCYAPFRRNLIGAPTHYSQFGLIYAEFAHRYPPEVEERLGTAPARELMQGVMVAELEKLAATHSVAVWRTWPEIDHHGGWIKCYMRLHVMTEAQYQTFAQTDTA